MTPICFSSRLAGIGSAPRARSVVLLTLCLGVAACSSDKTSDGSTPLASGIVREGATVPALNAFLHGIPDNWGWAGGVFDEPENGATLPADPPATFTWHADPTTPPDPSFVPDATKQNGQAFMLLFSSAAAPQLLQVFTDVTSYTPDAVAWSKLLADGSPISVNITSATYENDLLTIDGGPHTGQTIQITIPQ